MNPNFFPLLLLGHLWGDYMFQPKWMALNKSNDASVCFYHCLCYTTCICLFTQYFFEKSALVALGWPAFVFLSHYPIDRWSLADKWLEMIKGRSFDEFYTNTDGSHLDVSLTGGFTALVYAIVDNTMHLTLMTIGYFLLS